MVFYSITAAYKYFEPEAHRRRIKTDEKEKVVAAAYCCASYFALERFED